MTPLTREGMAAVLAAEIADGWHVNLGIGLPELVADRMPAGREIVLHSENGLLGMGPRPAPGAEDPDLINAGKKPVTILPGASFFDHATSFAIVRGRHLDLCVMGAYQVSARGDLANWARDADDPVPAVGGAMGLALGARRVWVLMTLTDRQGAPRLLPRCTYPLTAAGVVGRVFTELGIVEVTPAGLVVSAAVPGADEAVFGARVAAPVRMDAGCRVLELPG